jgi:hypothetical protein
MAGAKVRSALSLQFSLLALGLIVIHHVRYVFGRLLPHEQAASDRVHSYLPFMLILVVVLLALAVALFLRDVLHATRLRSLQLPGPPSFPRAWAQNSLLLVACYVLQETVEHRIAGEPLAVGEILLNRDGWIVLPLAAIVGGIIAALLRGARATIERAIARAPLARLPVRVAASLRPAIRPRARQFLLRGVIAGRAPPLPA